jgi:hypothetical protein
MVHRGCGKGTADHWRLILKRRTASLTRVGVVARSCSGMADRSRHSVDRGSREERNPTTVGTPPRPSSTDWPFGKPDARLRPPVFEGPATADDPNAPSPAPQGVARSLGQQGDILELRPWGRHAVPIA